MDLKKCINISISWFNLKIDNETIIKVKAYDELADFCYSNLKIGDFITISGTINDLFEIEIDFCQKL